MRVKNYIAMLIAASLLSGGLLAAFIIYEYKKLEQLSSDYYDVELSLKNLQQVEAILGPHLVEIDLILGSGETYLIDGSSKSAQNLIANLQEVESQVFPSTINSGVERSIEIIRSIDNILEDVNRSLLYLTEERSKQALLTDSLNRVDQISSQLVDDLPELIGLISKIAKQSARMVYAEKSDLRKKVIAFLLAYFAFLIFLWDWISRKISRPLEELTESALAASANGRTDFKIEHAPAEVMHLSARINTLLGSLQHQATHDPLTGLYNRRVLTARLQSIFQDWEVTRKTAILCYLDLDRFKYVNDASGHAAGDELLKHIAGILLENTRKSDLVARVGGDEFCLLFEDCSVDNVLRIAENIRAEVDQFTFLWGNNRFDVGCSIGVAQIHDHFSDVGEFINAADSACSMAKELGKNQIYRFDFTDTMLSMKRKHVQCIGRLTQAFEEGGFELFVQKIFPIVQRADNGKDHFEILLRMRSPEGELYEPTSFVPAAERYHMISKIDKWVVHNTISWLNSGEYDLARLALCTINLSGQSLCNDDVLNFIQGEIRASEIPAHLLCFEITETAVISNIAHAKVFIEVLRNMGCKFALDDFGSGLSSFAHLKDLKVDFLKIDGRFVKGLANDPFDYAAVRSINEIAKSCHLRTIAEFVNSNDAYDRLAEIGVDYAQGYQLHKPEPINVMGAKTRHAVVHAINALGVSH